MQGKRSDDICPIDPVMVEDFDEGIPILFPIHEIGMHEGGRPMMLRPVEFNATRDPGSKQTYQGRLDNLVMVDKIIAVRLVDRTVDLAANFREYEDFDIGILKVQANIGHIFLFVDQGIDDWVWIHLSARALVNPFFQKHGIFVWFANSIGRNCYCLLPYSCFFHRNHSFDSCINLSWRNGLVINYICSVIIKNCYISNCFYCFSPYMVQYYSETTNPNH